MSHVSLWINSSLGSKGLFLHLILNVVELHWFYVLLLSELRRVHRWTHLWFTTDAEQTLRCVIVVWASSQHDGGQFKYASEMNAYDDSCIQNVAASHTADLLHIINNKCWFPWPQMCTVWVFCSEPKQTAAVADETISKWHGKKSCSQRRCVVKFDSLLSPSSVSRYRVKLSPGSGSTRTTSWKLWGELVQKNVSSPKHKLHSADTNIRK